MFLDGRSLPDNSDFQADIVIIGAGAAGISIARALIGTALTVLLIESGGLEYDEEIQDLNRGESTGLPYADVAYNRLRTFGGTTMHWGGWCRPLDAVDFKVRAGVPYSGWPIQRETLDPYYAEAQALVEAGPYRYDDVGVIEAMAGARLDFKGDDLALGLYQYSPPTRFGEVYRDAIARAKNIKTLLHTTALEIRTSESGDAVTGLTLACLNGRKHTARGVRYVVAAGGIENPRLLLASTARHPSGIGNHNDVVGRFFMEHPHIVPGRVLLTPREKHVLRLMTDFRQGALHARPCFRPTEKLLGDSGLNVLLAMNIRTEFGEDGRPVTPDHPDEYDSEDDAALRIAVSKLGRIEQGVEPGPSAVEATIEVACEQAPNPASRIMLSDRRDALGMPRVQLEWRVQSADISALRTTLNAFAAFAGRNQLGFVRLVNQGVETWPGAIGWGNHHMGTTRMAADPRRGVVDRNCRVHGIDNLFIAGSSIFPTGGAANPTLTIVALALRLAEHLKGHVL